MAKTKIKKAKKAPKISQQPFGRFAAFVADENCTAPFFGLRNFSLQQISNQQVDWRTSGAVSTPKDQGDTNLCSSYALVAVVEALNFLKNHTKISLAPGFIHSCLLGLHDSQGVMLSSVIQAAAAHGIAYSFLGDTPFPLNQCTTGNTFSVRKAVPISGQNEAMHILSTQGPIAATLLIDPSFMNLRAQQIYIFQENDYQSLHSVAVIGYDLPQSCWIIANSFGTDWSDHGFGLIAFGTGGILTEGRPGWQIIL
ncbi:C1 family peptidase [Acinetobacter higginsii]|uniref:C1 family peptidase n=1 Tax=Acinetobacter higginsii TaxID=70347 RepID=UPI001F615D3D|nr:C1 family peptidase [Acinetobacter higginsii]MCI3878466.1 hypothetical protein [Acinetobacter higginsii]